MKLTAACCAALLSLLVCAPAGAADPAASGPVTFTASVRVDVDANGHLTAVAVPQEFPEAIRTVIERRVRSWQYQPAHVNGVAQPATSYLGIHACAVPVDGGYRMGVDFAYNGPRPADGKLLPRPRYPLEALHAGTDASFSVIVVAHADGRVSLVELKQISASGRAGLARFEPALREWVKHLRFDLETVAGQPVPTRIRFPVDFISGVRTRRSELAAEFRQQAMQSNECRMAAGETALRPVALQEPAVKVIPTPAG